MTDGPETERDLKRRSDELGARIAASRAGLPENRPGPDRTQGMRGVAEGFKIASEFTAGILVGAAIGFAVDRFAGTSPFGLIVFLLIGFAAGVLNVIRSTAKGGGGGDAPR